MTTRWIYESSDFQNVSAQMIGAKALNLMRLINLGMRVPPFFVVSAEAMQETIRADELDTTTGDFETACTRIRQHIIEAKLNPELVHAINAASESVIVGDSTLAVRSSSIAEDGDVHSFAGMYESVLAVPKGTSLIEAIKRVWLSVVNPRAIAYRRLHGLPTMDVKMAVIVQQLVDADRSGVCFTCDPMTQRDDRLIINSLFGLGEGLVSRSFSADTYRVDKSNFQIESDLAEKTLRLQMDRHSNSLVPIEVNPENQDRDSLTAVQLHEIAKVALAIEADFGRPQDIEFCYSDDQCLFIVQTRPITGKHELDEEPESKSAKQNHIIWDNSNIIESYSGVTTPMTFSFIRRAYSIVYHCFAEVMGIAPDVVQKNRDTFENMLGLFHGRVYYNLKNWYRLVRMFPGYAYNRDFMESMMGVKQSVTLEEQPAAIGRLQRWFVEFPSLLKLLTRSAWNFLRIRKLVAEFETHFYHHHDEWTQIDFDALPPHQLSELYDMMEQKMLSNWKAPIINDFFVMVFYGVLRKLCVSWCGDELASLQNGLVCGEGGLQSDEPAKRLIQMTQLVMQDPHLRELVLDQPLTSLPGQIAKDERFAEFNVLMASYLDDFGLRCADELKLESFSYQDQPERIYQLIRSYLTAKDSSVGDLDAIVRREQNIRRAAERQVEEKLAGMRFAFLRRLVFRRVLKNARLGIRNRENMRFARTRIYGILRRILRSLGRQFAQRGILDDREDIFYLTIDEVWSYVRGTAVTTDLRGLASLRKREYDSYRSETTTAPDDRFETFDLPYHANSYRRSHSNNVDDHDARLTGIGCCPGIVVGTVQVVRDPTRDTYFEGDILVAERTDPGWVPFYPAFSAILVERGSVLSHSAIVAREMGIPTIVAISGLTSRLRSGQRVKIDGRAGTVEVLEVE